MHLIDHIDRLRADLTGRTGRTPQFGWYVRTDPQIAEVYGRPTTPWSRCPSAPPGCAMADAPGGGPGPSGAGDVSSGGMRPTMSRGSPNASLLRAGWVGDTPN